MLLRAENITKSFSGKTNFRALDSASIYVCEGECVGLVGRSGSGKSTLAKIIAGLEAADSGIVAFDGQQIDYAKRHPLKNIPPCWIDMQMIFQNPEASFSDHMTIGQGICEGIAYNNRFSGADKRTLALAALEDVDLDSNFFNKRPYELSGGECQRAAIARAIISNPKLVICDEPTSSLDVTVQAEIMRLLERLNREHGTAFLFISHNMALVNNFCSRIYRIESGRVISELELEKQ